MVFGFFWTFLRPVLAILTVYPIWRIALDTGRRITVRMRLGRFLETTGSFGIVFVGA